MNTMTCVASSTSSCKLRKCVIVKVVSPQVEPLGWYKPYVHFHGKSWISWSVKSVFYTSMEADEWLKYKLRENPILGFLIHGAPNTRTPLQDPRQDAFLRKNDWKFFPTTKQQTSDSTREWKHAMHTVHSAHDRSDYLFSECSQFKSSSNIMSLSGDGAVASTAQAHHPCNHEIFNNLKQMHTFENTDCIAPQTVPSFDNSLKLSFVAEGPVPKKAWGGNKAAERNKSGMCTKYTQCLLEKTCNVSCKNQKCKLYCMVLNSNSALVMTYRELYANIKWKCQAQ